MMDRSKICFIICSNDREQLGNCIEHIQALEVPEGFQTEIQTVENATSILEGYQQAMSQSDAKYKIYLHQDVWILYKRMLFEMLDIFQHNEDIGLMGVIGYKVIAQSAVMWELRSTGCGKVYSDGYNIDSNREVYGDYEDVKVIDGLFMATQYDVPWRTDLLEGWHFYDVSCSLEHLNAGYRIVIPKQQEMWCMHNHEEVNLEHYHELRDRILEEYNAKQLDMIQQLIEEEKLEAASEAISKYTAIWEYGDEIAALEAGLLMRLGEYGKALGAIKTGLQYLNISYELIMMMGEVHELLDHTTEAGICYRQAAFLGKDSDDEAYLTENYMEFKTRCKDSIPNMTVLIKTTGDQKWLSVCLELLEFHSNPESYEVVFLTSDQDADDMVQRWIKQQGAGRLISYNKGQEIEAYNQAINMAGRNSDIVILQEGALPMENSLFNLQLELYSVMDTGAVGSIADTNTCQTPFLYDVHDLKDAIKFSLKCNTPGMPGELKIKLNSPLIMLKRSCINQNGWFDSRFSSISYALTDLNFRLIKSGLKLKLCHNSYVYKAGESVETFDERQQNEIFKKKWNINLTYSCNQRQDLISLVSSEKEDPLNILDIGCACGATLLSVKHQYPNAKLYGIELDEGPAAIAKNFASITNEDIEKSSLSYPAGFFDYIFCGDILEHLYDPQKVLANLRPYLKDGGYILASIPNVMHITVINDLLLGNWTYQDAGILDRTHLRFFTYSEILKMFSQADYQIEGVFNTSIMLPAKLEELVNMFSKMTGVSEQLYKSYQYLVKAKK